MGNCVAKDTEDYKIICDNQGYIKSCTKPLLNKMRFHAKTLEGQFIGILMSDFMSMLHRHFFISAFHASKGVDRNKLENKMRALHSKRSLIIYDIDKTAHIVHVSIEYKSPDFHTLFEFFPESEDLFYSDILHKPCSSFKLNSSDAIIIKTDFVKSTDLLNTHGALSLIDTSTRFYGKIQDLIRTKYYPYVYLHEVVGDSFVLVMNTDWTYNFQKLCATLAINFVFDLVQQTRDFIEIRTGIGYGQLHYGKIGQSLTFFGYPMNIAARLENKCNINEINACQTFHKKLVSELELIGITKRTCSLRRDSLKGFGEVEYYSIPVSVDESFAIYGSSIPPSQVPPPSATAVPASQQPPVT